MQSGLVVLGLTVRGGVAGLVAEPLKVAGALAPGATVAVGLDGCTDPGCRTSPDVRGAPGGVLPGGSLRSGGPRSCPAGARGATHCRAPGGVMGCWRITAGSNLRGW